MMREKERTLDQIKIERQKAEDMLDNLVVAWPGLSPPHPSRMLGIKKVSFASGEDILPEISR